MQADDLAQFLASSPDRRALLTHLRDTAGAPAELADALNLSRRSVQRHLSDFVDRGLATKTDGAYRLTPTGTLVVDEHVRYRETLDRIETFGEFYQHLPDAAHSPDPRWLGDATLTTATPADPQAPVQAYLDSVREFEGDRIRMISPVLSRLYHKAHAELAFDQVHTELVLSGANIDRARDANPIEFKVVVSVDILDLYRYPDSIAFGLTFDDTRLLMGAYDDAGQLRACVESTNEAFVDWSADLFERYRSRSDMVDPPLSLPFSLGA